MSKYYYRILVAGFFALCSTVLFAQGPGGVPDTNLSFWLRSDKGVTTSSGTVTDWLDQSSNGNDANDETAPAYTAASSNWNNQPTITFSSASLNIDNSTAINDGDQSTKTMTIAFRSPSSIVDGNELIYEQGGGTNGLVFYINGDGVNMTLNMGIYTGSGSNYAFESVAITTSTNYIATFTFDNSGTAGYLNNSTAGFTTLTGGTTPINPLLSHTGDITIGNNTGDNRGAGITIASGSAFNGEITELIQYNRVLNSVELEALSNYLSSKYDITIPNDRYSGDTVGNGNYDFDLVLLGNDGASAQTFVNNNFYTVTETGLASGEYIGVGDDGNALALVTATGLSRSYRIERTWSIDITGSTNVIDNLSFPDSGAENYLLLFDDLESFNTPLEVSPTSTVGGVISFNNVDLSSFAGIIYMTVAADVNTPGGTTTIPKLWFRADAGVEEANGDDAEDTDPVQFWRDQSGNGNNAVQSTLSERAVWDNSNTINGNPVLTFDGSDDHMAIANLFYDNTNTLDEMTVYAVTKTTKSSEGIVVSYDRSSFYRFSTRGDGDVRLGSNQGTTITDFDSQNTTVDDGNPHLIGADFDGITTGDQRHFFDGALNNTQNTGTGFLGNASEIPRYGFISKNSEATAFDGAGGGDEFQGDIAEIVYFETVLSAAERNQLESYLAIKYGMTLSSNTDGDATAFESGEGDYLSSDGTTVVWDADVNQTYHNDIVGVANSQDGAFSQTSSRSTNTTSILTVTEASLSNEEYILLGHNGSGLSSSVSSSSFNRQLDRVWKTQITGSTTTIDQLQFDLNGLSIQPETAADIALLVDDNESFTSPAEISGTFTGGVLTLTNVDLSSGNVFFTIAFTLPSPAGVGNNLAFWFKADAGVEEANGDASEDGDLVRFWRDQSGNEYFGEQSNAGERPVYDASNTINFNPVITFDGDTHLPIRDLNYNITTNTLDEFTIYSIVKSNQTGEGIVVSYDRSSFFRFALNHNGTSNFGLSTNVEGAPDAIDDNNSSSVEANGVTHLLGGDYATSTDTKHLYFDGIIADTYAGAHGATGGILGASGEVPRFGYISANSEASTFDGSESGNGLDGDLAEIIYFEGILSSTERARIETYLAIKYGVTLGSDYVASDGTSEIWDNSLNTGYNNDVAAIGLDNVAGINQTQSRSESNGAILTGSNAGLSDGDYVFWGSDEGDLSVITDGTGTFDGRFNRIWKIQITGGTTNVDQLLFDLSEIVIKPNAPGNYAILVDDVDDFASVIREVSATSLTNGILQFDNVDLSGATFISLAVTPDLDNDGVADLTDIDDDNDGLLDTDEGNGLVDTDFDGIVDSRDLDSDNDGIGDLYESGAEGAGSTIATLDVNGDGVIDIGNEGANGLDNRLEVGDIDGGGLDYTVSNSDGDAVVDFRDLDSDNNGISDLVESGRSTAIDTDDDGIFEGTDSDLDGVPDEVDTQDLLFGSTLTANNQDGIGEPDFRDLDNDEDGEEDIDEVQLTDTTPDDGRLDGSTDADGDGIILERDNDDNAGDDGVAGESFGQIDLATLVTGAGQDWYSYRSGPWTDPDNWTLDPSGSTRVNPGSEYPSDLIDNVTILNGDEMTLNFNALVLSSLAVEEGGVVNLGTTINHNFNTITGSGKISLATNDFPGGDITDFSATTGGTVEYIDQSPVADYELTVARTLNNVIINSAANTITLKADLTLNGNLSVTSGTLQINDNTGDAYVDNTTPLNVTVNGNMTVDASGSVTVGNVDASTELGSSDVFNFHQLEILGNLTNNGSMVFTNLSPTSISDGRYRDKYPTAADFDNNLGSNDIPASEFGVVEVLFTNGTSDQLITLNGTSDFYRIEVRKGTSQTFIAEINASATANFRLLGRIAMNQSDDSGNTPNIDNHRALGLEAGILKLGDNIVIEQIAKPDGNGASPSTQGGNRNYIIDLDAQLWLSSNAYVTKEHDWGIHPFGKLKVSDNATLTFTGTGQRTILVDNQGVFEMTGGTVNVTQFRNKTGADGAPRGSFVMTGGTMNIGGGGVDGNHGVFSIPWEEQNFIFSAADEANPPEINITLDGNRGKDNAAIQIGVKDGNYDVGVGSININHTSNTDYKISSTTPLYNLSYNSTGSAELIIDDIEDADDFAPSNASATLPDDNSGTIPSPAMFAQALVIENDLTIQDGRLDANDLDVTVRNILTIESGAEYDPGANTTFFDGTSPIQRVRLNGAAPFVGGGFNNLVFTGSGTEKEFAGDLTTAVVLGDMTIGSGVTLNDNGKTLQVNGDLNHSGIHTTDAASPGRIEITGGAVSHEIGGDGNGRFSILEIDDAVNAISLTTSHLIDSVLILTNGALDINTNQLTISSTAANPILDDLGGNSNFGTARMIQTAGNASDGGINYYFDGLTANPGGVLYPLGTNANASVRYTPAVVDLSNISDDGYVQIRMADVELQTVDLSALSNNMLTYYWRVSSSDFTSLPTVDSYQFTADDNDDPDGGATPAGLPVNFVPGKVLDESPFTRSQENTSDVSGLDITFDGAGAGFTLENANYTAGDGTTTLFTGSPDVYYTTLVGWIDWTDETKWSLTSDGVDDGATGFPQAGDVAVIKNYGNGNGNHWVNANTDVTVAEVIFDNSLGGWSPRIRVTDRTANLDWGPVSGVGQIQLMVRTAEVPTFLGNTDLGSFSREVNSQFNFNINADNQVVDMPSNILEYPQLRIEAGNGDDDDDNRILRTTVPITINNSVLMDRSPRFRINHDVTITSDLRITWQQNRTTVELGDDRQVTLDIGGDLRMENGQGSDAARFVVKNDNLMGYEHTVRVRGNIEFESGLEGTSTFDLYNGTGSNNNAILELTGEGNFSFTNNSDGVLTPDLYRLVINKGSDQTSTFTFNNTFNLNGDVASTLKALELQNGTLALNDSNIDITLSSGGGDFEIPASAGLTLQSGTARITATGTGTGNGLRLNGKITISGGDLILDGGAGADNYIEYGSAGGSEIEITSGNLIVGSQLRRNTLSDDGVISYTQSGGTALFGARTALENSRGVFEIINTGTAGSSSFNLSGASTTFAIIHGQSSPQNGTFIIDSDVNVSVTSDPYIDFGFNGTVASTTYQNDLNETYEINSASVLPNIRIDNANFNSPILEMVVQSLTVTDNLEILNNGTLVSNNFDLTINSGFTNDGTYTPGSNTTTFNGTSQLVGGSTNTVFNNLNVNATTSVTLSNPITVNGDLNILTGNLNDAGNRVSLLGELNASADHLSDGSGLGGISMDGLSKQEIRVPDGAVSIDKLLINNINDVAIIDQGGLAVVITIEEELALENGLLELGDNRLIFDPSAQATTSTSFGSTRMISVNGVKKSDGVEKQFLNGIDAPAFEIPVGTPDKYTPVTLDVDASNDPGSILVKPINAIHPSATGPDALNYYWVVTTTPTTVTGFSGSISFEYLESDANNAGQNESTWENNATRLIAPNWFKPSGNLVDITNNIMTFSASDLSSFGGTTFDGEFTIGNDIPDQLAMYRSIGNGTWNTIANWEIDVDGDGWDDGNGVPQPGTIVIVNTGDEVTMSSATDNDQNIFSLQIDGTLDVSDSDGHNFGDVSGTGTLRISNSTLPGGNYDNFFTTTAGSLDLSGASSYTISPDFASGLRGLTISGGGTKTLPSIGLIIGSDGIVINDGATLDNSVNNNTATVTGDVTINNGSFLLGNASASLQAQNLTLTSGTFTSTGSAIDLSGNVNMNGGTFNAGSGILSIDGNITLAGAATFNNDNGTVALDGGADQTIGGDFSAENFNNLRINKTGGEVLLAASTSVNVANVLTLDGGNIDTQASGASLRLLNGVGSISRTTGFISGPLQVDLSDGNSFSFPVGKNSTYKPVQIGIQNSSQTTNPLTWEVEYYAGSADDFSSVENDITSMSNIETNADPDEQVVGLNTSDYWRIDTGAESATLDAVTIDISNVGLSTDDINDQLLQVMVWDEAGGEWDHLGGVSSGSPSDANVVSTSTLSFSEKIITSGAETATALPVELISFEGVAENNEVLLTWETASEVNNDYFDVQRSRDGVEFQSIGRVNGNGNSNAIIKYDFVDKNPYAGFNYYRLKQVDYDGTATDHQVIQVNNDDLKKNLDLVIYPNPSTGRELHLRITSSDSFTPISIQVNGLKGERYLTDLLDPEGNATIDFSKRMNLKDGLYVVTIHQNGQSRREKLLVRN